jgi:hypothetical protein
MKMLLRAQIWKNRAENSAVTKISEKREPAKIIIIKLKILNKRIISKLSS